MGQRVCVTGASGFVGSHVVAALLAAGATVRGAVRAPDDLERTGHLRTMADASPGQLELVAADLLQPGSFDAAVDGCDSVVHVAAVARLAGSDPQAQIVDPSVAGTRNVLGAVERAPDVKRVVMTSSIAAVGNYRAAEGAPLDESSWNDAATLQSDPYGMAKTHAERLAWELQAGGRGWSLVTLNPGLVLGPVFNRRHLRASPAVVVDLMLRRMPACPRICFPVIDARDVADAHVRALQSPDAAGRHILVGETLWMQDVARILHAAHPDRPVPLRQLPNVAMRLAGLFDKRMSRATLRDILDRVPQFSAARARERLALRPRPAAESVRDTAASMVALGLLEPRAR